MKTTKVMRINDMELCCLYEILDNVKEGFFDHYKEDESPVYFYSIKNEVILKLYLKLKREITSRGIVNNA